MVRTSLGAEFTANVDVRGAEDVATVTADTGTTVPSQTTQTDIIRPPNGFVYELLSFRFRAPPLSGASSGSHGVFILNESVFVTAYVARSFAADPVAVTANTTTNGTKTQIPSTETAQLQSLRGLRASPNNGFEVQYRNSSNVAQNQQRQIRFWFRLIEVERV